MSAAATFAKPLALRLAVVAWLMAVGIAHAQLPALAPQPDLPIDLDAASSQFDRRNNRLIFQRMKITQGPLQIIADMAEATRLDFENSIWIFRGNVVIENGGARVSCDDAQLRFLGHQLRSARVTGTPARFEQQRGGAQPTRGSAGAIDYDVTGATIRLSGDAWLSDGGNEVLGDRISYDLRREYVTADSAGEERVRMRITPPGKKAPTGETP